MLSDKAKNELKRKIGLEKDCDFEINRKSKWIVEISLVDGLCLYAKFKFNCKKHSMERII